MVLVRLHAAKRLDLATREAIFDGTVVVFKQLPSALRLCEHFASALPEHEDLATAPHADTPEEERVALCRRFERDPVVRELFKGILAEVGCAADSTYWDRIRLRVQQSGADVDDTSRVRFGVGRYSCTLPAHRDTWASNVPQQLNWWFPLRPIDEGRTLAVHPSFFRKAVPNTSAQWDFHALKAARKAGERYPQLPELALRDDDGSTDPVRDAIVADARPIVVSPGDVVCFSGAHLHSSVVNTTGRTRFSAEFRAVVGDDFEAGRGAPNVDGKAPRMPVEWFSRVADGVALGK